MKRFFSRRSLLISEIIMLFSLIAIFLNVSNSNIFMFGLNITITGWIGYKLIRPYKNVKAETAYWAIAFAIFFATLNLIYYIFMGPFYNLNIADTFGYGFIVVYISQIIGLFYILYSCIESLLEVNGSFEVKSLKKIWIGLFVTSFIISYIFLMILYPAVMSFDSVSQLNQALGVQELSNHHPIFMTMLLKLAVSIGQTLGLSQYGIAVYPFVQIIINGIVFTSATCFLIKKRVSKLWLLPFIIYLYCNPVVYVLNVTIWKDVQLATSFLIVIMFNTEYILNTENFVKKKSNLVLFALFMMIFTLWKSNALYAVLLSFILYIITMKGYRVINIILLVSVMLFNNVVTGPIYTAMGGTQGEAREALSLPFQQLGGIMSSDNRNVTQEEIDRLAMYIDVNAAENNYNPQLSDPIKNTFNEEQFSKDKLGFFEVWFDIFKDNLALGMKATFQQTAEYYAIPNNSYTVQYGVRSGPPGGITPPPESSPLFPFKAGANEKLAKWEFIRRIPVIYDIWSIGLLFWIAIVLLYIYYKKYNKRAMLVLAPPLVMWLTLIDSPVNGEYRYAYPFIIAVLYLLAYSSREGKRTTTSLEMD